MKKETTELELIPPPNQATFDATAKTYNPSAETAVARRSEQSLAVAQPHQELNLQSIADRILTGDLTSEKMALIKDLVAMDAERKFTVAFNALQADLPTIVASSVIPNRGKYERFEDVMHQIAPFLTKHGFTVSFSQDVEETRIIETCHLSHIGGHSRKSSFAVRVARADSETQSDVKAATTAKRKALQDALNIVIRQDCLNEEQDASLEGGNISAEKADELERRVALLNQPHDKFLKWLQVKSYAEIPVGKYAIADEFLSKKERGQ